MRSLYNRIHDRSRYMLFRRHAEEMELEVTDTRVIVTLPQTEIQSVHVDPDSIVFYDESIVSNTYVYHHVIWSIKDDLITEECLLHRRKHS